MQLEMLGDAFLSQQRLLVVAPHPDDEAIGCAGTIARVKALNGQVYVMIVSAGGITQHGRGAGDPGRGFVPGEQRRAEFEDMTRAAGPGEHTSRCCEGRGLDTQSARAVAREHQGGARRAWDRSG
jgi:LmbE family N-acetylglucosaminyl deacetylase